MTSPGNQFLPSPAFASDQHIHQTVADLIDEPDDVLHFQAGSDQFLGWRTLFHLSPKLGIFLGQLGMLLLKRLHHLFGFKGKSGLGRQGFPNLLVAVGKSPGFLVQHRKHAKGFPCIGFQGYG